MHARATRQHVRCACTQQHPTPLTKEHTLSLLLLRASLKPSLAGFIVPCSCSWLCVLIVCAKRADHSTKGSVLLTQLFRESAREANQEYYATVSNKHLKALKTTFTSFVPDNFQQVAFVDTAHDEAYKPECPCCIGDLPGATMLLGLAINCTLQCPACLRAWIAHALCFHL